MLSGRITYTRPRARRMIEEFLSRQCCQDGTCGTIQLAPPGRQDAAEQGGAAGNRAPALNAIGHEFIERAIAEQLNPCDIFRVTITSFMDAYNFDLRQLMKSCVSFVLPSGHLVPFSAYNVLYREGHARLPEPRILPRTPSKLGLPKLTVLP